MKNYDEPFIQPYLVTKELRFSRTASRRTGACSTANECGIEKLGTANIRTKTVMINNY